MIDDIATYTLMTIMFVVILLLVGWLVVLTRLVYIKNTVMHEDLTDLENTNHDHFIAITNLNARLDGLVRDVDVMDFVEAMNEAAIRTRPLAPRENPEGGNDVVYVTGH